MKRRDNYYLRARVYDADGKRIDIYGKDEEELAQKVLEAQKKIEDLRFRKVNPTVAEYSEKWLEMQAAHVRPSTLRGYELTVRKYIIQKKFKPEPGQRCVNWENIVYCLDFKVTPHQLRHTYITNLIHAGVYPKTVQYLAGHENSQVTMDIYAKAKYNRPEELSEVVNGALKLQADSDES